MVEKIRAAIDARSNPDLLIIARTDARAVEGLDEALHRARRYRDAGADVLFIEAPQDQEELLSLPSLIDAPHVVNIVQGGKTPVLPRESLSAFSIALYANLSLQASVFGMQEVLRSLLDSGTITSTMEQHIADWSERQRLVRKPLFDELEQRYSPQGESS